MPLKCEELVDYDQVKYFLLLDESGENWYLVLKREFDYYKNDSTYLFSCKRIDNKKIYKFPPKYLRFDGEKLVGAFKPIL